MNKQPTHHTQAEQEAKHTSRGDERRQELVIAAYQVIAQKGFDGLRVRDVAARAGVNIATLHYYFPTKEDLVRAVVGHARHQFETHQIPAAPTPQDAAQKLRLEFVDLEYQIDHYPDLFIVLHELRLQARRNTAIKAILDELETGWHEYLEGIFREGLQSQVFRTDLDPDRAAWLVIAMINGMQIINRSNLLDANYISDMMRCFEPK